MFSSKYGGAAFPPLFGHRHIYSMHWIAYQLDALESKWSEMSAAGQLASPGSFATPEADQIAEAYQRPWA
jgi:hypothetical protein